MRTIRIVKRRVHSLLHRSSADAELQREIEIHIQQLTNEAIAAGMTEVEARAMALREFGPIEQIKEKCRDTRRVSWIQDFVQDLRYGVRMLRQSPGFTAVAVLTLALGIGANTAIFSIVDAVLLRSLPYRDPNQLVLMFDVPLNRPDALSGISYRDFTECRAQNRVFSQMAGNTFHDLTLTGAGEPSIVNTADVTPEIFPLLNAKPLAGPHVAARGWQARRGGRGCSERKSLAQPLRFQSGSYWPIYRSGHAFIYRCRNPAGKLSLS